MNMMLKPLVYDHQLILADLINSLLVEGYILESMIFTKAQLNVRFEKKVPAVFEIIALSPETNYFVILEHHVSNELLIIPLVEALLQPWKIHGEIYYLSQKQQTANSYPMGALEVFDVLQRFGIFESANDAQLAQFRQDFSAAIHHHTLSQTHGLTDATWLKQDPATLFKTLEQYAALRDRPYHPLAKLKDGFSTTDYQRFSPEFEQKIAVRWVAVRKSKLVYAKGIMDDYAQQPAKIFLDSSGFMQLQHELEQKKIAIDYLALPVHPWQFEHIIATQFEAETAAQDLWLLEYQSNCFFASSSLRTLLCETVAQDHLKLPLAVKSLGSLRFLPIVKMINGQKNQNLLEQAKLKDQVLAEQLWLCDENQWWGYLPEQQDDLSPDNLTLFDEKPMFLAAQRRKIPTQLLAEPYQIIPMASLGQLVNGGGCMFDLILKWQHRESTVEQVYTVFTHLCQAFFEFNLRLLRMGLVGEIHGQNISVVLKNGEFSGFLLRDHDSLRIHLPWMQQAGLDDPHYLSPHDFRITLYHDQIEDLVVYLQTLGIQVNLASILDTIAEYYGLDQVKLWKIVSHCLANGLDTVPFSSPVLEHLSQLFFDTPEWPYKQLIRPLLEQTNRIGSMPSKIGQVRNVLRHVAHMALPE